MRVKMSTPQLEWLLRSAAESCALQRASERRVCTEQAGRGETTCFVIVVAAAAVAVALPLPPQLRPKQNTQRRGGGWQ